MRVLGISAFYHDSAAALVVDGRVVAAAQEERFTRKKNDSSFPKNAVEYCLREGNCTLADLDAVAFYDKPFIKFERLIETYLAFAPRGLKSFGIAMPAWLREKLFQKSLLRNKLREISDDFDSEKLLFSEHHFAHAASAFFPSPFAEAAVLTLDGVGEWTTSSLAIGTGRDLRIHKELHFPHSLGLLYSAFTYYAGFKVNSGEYKVMGLAPYGEPRYLSKIQSIVDLKEDGTFRLDQRYFDYCTGLTMTSGCFSELFGQPARKPEEPLTQFHMDIAASVQAFTEEVMLRLARSVRAQTGMRNLCLAGGVALNCVANGKIFERRIFDDVWIQPAAGDAGGSVGAALAAYYGHFGQKRDTPPKSSDGMQGAYLGPGFSQDAAAMLLQEAGAKFSVYSDQKIVDLTASALSEGKAVGWMNGRMEFGPRSLGNRSILGDPRSPSMQKNLNLKVKYRESFRPFAPSVLREDVSDWFEFDADSPYMLLVAGVKRARRRQMNNEEEALFGIDKLNVPRSEIPAVTHVDYSARIQTVHAATNPRYHALLTRFKELAGCPVLVNTSFNVRGEPIVCSPEDAFRCFMGSELDVLVVENCFLLKEQQNSDLKIDYKNAFDLD